MSLSILGCWVVIGPLFVVRYVGGNSSCLPFCGEWSFFFVSKIRSFGLVMRGKHGKDFSAQNIHRNLNTYILADQSNNIVRKPKKKPKKKKKKKKNLNRDFNQPCQKRQNQDNFITQYSLIKITNQVSTAEVLTRLSTWSQMATYTSAIAKSICLNFGLAQAVTMGQCNLRFDDTNPWEGKCWITLIEID